MKKMIYTIAEVHEKVGKGIVEIDGDKMKMNSDRYRLFKAKGTKCVCCGLEGTYYEKTEYFERKVGTGKYHFNLYGTKNGKPMLFTKDHILPKSKGGRNHISNYQTMCVECNSRKGDRVDG